MQVKNKKKPSIWLGAGIILLPIIFFWFTLRKGYSLAVRLLSFVWLLLSFIVIATINAPVADKTDRLQRLQPHYSADLEPEAKGLIQSNFDALLRTCPGLLTYSDDLAFERATDNFHFAELNNAQASAENQVPLQANLVYKVNDNPSSLLRKWGASGHSCFYSFARDGKTLSIVKTPCQSICLGRESQNQGTLRLNLKMTDAERAASVSKAQSQPDKSLPKKKLWYEGGTLHKKNGLDWQQASDADKLATCADFIALMLEKEVLRDDLVAKMKTAKDIKPYAQALVKELDIAFGPFENAKENKQVFTNQKVAQVAVMTALLMGWTKS